jgi:hypothetical protein
MSLWAVEKAPDGPAGITTGPNGLRIVGLCVSQPYAVGETVTAVENERRYVCPIADEENI